MTAGDGDRVSDVVEAAGGVLWRAGAVGREFAVIHRPRYDDWTLPKGKVDAGETHEQAALREIAEETGFAAELGPPLSDARYHVRGRPKRVRYWGMRALGGRFAANHEVDDLRWLPLDQARALLTYDRDRELIDEFGGRSTPDADAPPS